MIKKYSFLFFLLISVSAFAQNTVLKGQILDAHTAQPLAGAKIQTEEGDMTSSDEKGIFQLPCGEGLQLRVSFVGYEKYSIRVKDCQQFLNIALVPETSNLEEVRLLSNLQPEARSLEQPVSEVKLNRVELQRGTGLFLDDAINANVPGVTMQRRAVSSGQQFNIRGYGNGVGFRGASNNFDGQGYKVYLNGIPITDAEGVTVLDDIDFESIGSVDVIKGPAGSLYGFAIAGVVKLETLQPERGETSVGQNVTFGDYGLLRLSSDLRSAGENSSILANYGHQTVDGYMAHTASQKDFANAMLNFSPNEKQRISAYFGYSNSYDERGGELTIDQYEEKDYSGNSHYIKNNAHSEVISFRAGLSHEYRFNDEIANTTTIFGTGVSSNSSSAGGWTDKDPLNYGLRSSFDLNFHLNDQFRLSGIAGLELQKQHANISGYRMLEDPDNPNGYNIIGETKSDQQASSVTSNYFTEWILKMPLDFSFTAGIGMSSMKIGLEDRLYDPESDRPRNVSANYSNLFSPHFAINKIFSKNVSVYASYSKAYNAPVSGNIVLSTSGELNTGLKPEVGEQFEIGSKGQLLNDRLYYQLAVFRTLFKDKFTSVAVPLDEMTTAYTYIANGGDQDHRGVEGLVKYAAYTSDSGLFSLISPYANFTYSDFVYKDYRYESLDSEGTVVSHDYSGNAVAGTAPWVVNAGVDLYSNSGLYGNLNFSWRDAMPFTSDGENVADAYHLLNAKLGYRHELGNFELDVFAGAKNITGSQYYYMVFLNQLPDAYLPAPYEINYFGGLNLRYNF